MAYLVVEDYTRQISLNHLNEILDQAREDSPKSRDQTRVEFELQAMAEVNSYLNKLYNMTAEFGKTNTDPSRNENVLRAVLVIVMYNIHFTINPNDIPEIREKAYERIREDLSAARDGELDFDIPARPSDATQGMGRTTIGSSRKFISKPFTDPSIITDIV